MSQFINAKDAVVTEATDGLLRVSGGRLSRLDGYPHIKVVFRSDWDKSKVALISGGLDSMLAVRVMQEQGIEVEGINFYTGFCVEGHTHAIRNQDKDKQKRNNALWVAEQLGIKLHIIDVIEEYKDVLLIEICPCTKKYSV